MNEIPTRSFYVGSYFIDVSRHEVHLSRHKVVTIQFKSLMVLSCLAEHYPDVLTRAQLIDMVWQGNELIGETGLTNAIWSLRQLFKDEASANAVIDTIRGKGYQLRVAPRFTNDTYSPDTDASKSWRFDRLNNWFGSKRRWGAVMTLLTVLVPAAWLAGIRPLAASAPVGGTPHIITSQPGRELYPQVSANPERIVYVAINADGKHTLRINDPLQQSVEIYRSSGHLQSPNWLGDSSHLIFKEQIKTHDAPCLLRLLDTSTGELTDLYQCATEVTSKLGVARDGRHFAIAEGAQIRLFALDGKTAVLQQQICETNCEAAAAINELALNHDGSQLLFGRQLSPLIEDVFLWDVKANTTRRMSHGVVDVRGLQWLPGDDAFLLSEQSGHMRLASYITLDNLRRYTLPWPGFSAPSVHENGTVYYHNWVLHHHTGVIDSERPKGAVPLQKGTANIRCAEYSAMTAQLVYVSNETGHDELWLSDSQQIERRQISNAPRQISCASWSPDGKRLAYTMQAENFADDEIWVYELATQSHSSYRGSWRTPFAPIWSKDGATLLFNARDADGHSNLIELTLATQHSKAHRVPAFSHLQAVDAQRVWLKPDHVDGLWLWDLRKQQALGQHWSMCNAANNWRVTEPGIFCEQRIAGGHRVLFVDHSEKEIRVLAELPAGMVAETGRFSYAAQDKRLYLTLDEPAESNIYAANLQLP